MNIIDSYIQKVEINNCEFWVIKDLEQMISAIQEWHKAEISNLTTDRLARREQVLSSENVPEYLKDNPALIR